MTAPTIADRFRGDIADHQMTVLRDDGLYRHLRFERYVWRPPLVQPSRSSLYWFEIITVPNTLIFQGDGEAFVFRRVRDMFEFFRGQHINPQYWAEKLVSHRSVKHYDPDKFVATVKESFVDRAQHGGVPAGTGRALLDKVLDPDVIYDERLARDALHLFRHKGFRFEDTWEWDFEEYDWWFLWACQAIVWGIEYYDTHTRPDVPDLPSYLVRSAVARLGRHSLTRQVTTGRRRGLPHIPGVETVETVGGVL